MDNDQNLSEESEFFNGIVDLAESMQQLANDACAIYELQVIEYSTLHSTKNSSWRGSINHFFEFYKYFFED